MKQNKVFDEIYPKLADRAIFLQFNLLLQNLAVHFYTRGTLNKSDSIGFRDEFHYWYSFSSRVKYMEAYQSLVAEIYNKGYRDGGLSVCGKQNTEIQ